MKKRTIMSKVLMYLMVLSILLSGFINKTPYIEAEVGVNKPVTYAKYNSAMDHGGSFDPAFPSVEADRGRVWYRIGNSDSLDFDNNKKAFTYTATASGTSWAHLFFDKEYKTTGNDYWISVLFKQADNKNFHSAQLFQSSDYKFTLHTSSVSRATWSYSNVSFNGEDYKLATAKISGFGSNQTVTGVRVYAEQASYTVYSTAIYSNEQDALSYAGMFPTYEANDYLSYGLYNTESDFKGLKPSDSVPLVDPGTAWGSPDCIEASFNTDLKGASFTSQPSARTWVNLYFNKEYTTTGDDYVIAVLYKHKSFYQYISSSFNQLKDYQFGLHSDAYATVPFLYTSRTINGQSYTLAYASVINMNKGEKVTGVQVSLTASQSCTFIAAVVLKNDVDVGNIFNSILTTTKPLEEGNGKYEGSQIRTKLVPYKDKDGQIVMSDMRQGLRFCFTLPEVGNSIVYQGKQYEVQEQKAMVILKDNLVDKGELSLDNQAIADKLIIQSDLIDWSDGIRNLKSVYVYNIRIDNKDTTIVVRAYLVCKDNMGETVYFYSDVQEKSLTDVYNSILAAGDVEILDQDVKAWWS